MGVRKQSAIYATRGLFYWHRIAKPALSLRHVHVIKSKKSMMNNYSSMHALALKLGHGWVITSDRKQRMWLPILVLISVVSRDPGLCDLGYHIRISSVAIIRVLSWACHDRLCVLWIKVHILSRLAKEFNQTWPWQHIIDSVLMNDIAWPIFCHSAVVPTALSCRWSGSVR